MRCKKKLKAQGLPFSIVSCTSHRAFSLIELLVTILLSFIVMGAIYSVYRVQTRSMKVQENRMEAQQYVRSV
ncbi:MAG: PilW family protein, partial [Candidatus Binatia bacterium]